jgi:hypothetical protein
MTSDNSVADRLLEEARRRTARHESPTIGKVAVGLGALALLVSPVSILGWLVGAIAIGTGATATQRPVAAGRGRIAIALGAAAVLVGVFFFSLNVARA